MARRPASYELPLLRAADGLGASSFYVAFRSAILEGRLRPGTRVPSSREIARKHEVARGTVVSAYEQLAAEGYLDARIGSGTRVSAVLPDALLCMTKRSRNTTIASPAVPSLSVRGALLAGTPFPAVPSQVAGVPFVPHVPALREFPVKLWATIAAKRARSLTVRDLGDGEARGHFSLRRAIAEYLGTTRGVRCTEDQVIVLSSVQQALDLSVRLLLDEGDVAWCEDPGYGGALAAFRVAGVKRCPIPVDRNGLNVDWAIQRHPHARMAYVTPAHQAPLGVSLSLSRRLSLLAWAHKSKAWIFEDDYDSEYRYSGRPMPPLQSLDENGRVLYTGCFSKTLFPALRIAYLIVPPALANAFAAARSVTSRYSPVLDQLVLAEFMEQGHYARHLRRMRELYAVRRALLVELLAKRLAGKLEVLDNPTGLNVVGWLTPGLTEDALLEKCRKRGLIVHTLNQYSADTKKPGRAGVVLGFASLTPSALSVATSTLAQALNT